MIFIIFTNKIAFQLNITILTISIISYIDIMNNHTLMIRKAHTIFYMLKEIFAEVYFKYLSMSKIANAFLIFLIMEEA